MSFLNPLALWGLASLAVPIILLIFLHRRKLVLHWAAFEWMQKALVKHRQKILVTDLLKLISKLLLLLALALMIARPFLTSRGGGGRTLVIVDASPSMGAILDDGTRLDRAVKLAGDFINRHIGPVALFTFAGELEPVVSDFTGEKGPLLDRLRTIKLRKTFAGIGTLVQQLPLQAAYARAQRVVFFGDFQAAWFGDGRRTAEELRRLGKGCPMTWVQVDDRSDPENGAVTALALSPDGAFGGRSSFLNLTVLNGAGRQSSERTITVQADNRQVARFVTRFETHEKKDLSFLVQFKEPGFHNVRVMLDGDALPLDNTRSATIDVPPPLKLLAVVPAPNGEPFAADTWFKAAMRGLLPGDALVYRSVSPLEFETANLDDVDIVVTVRTALPAGSSLAQKLQAFLARGGAVVAFLPAETAQDAEAFGLAAGVSAAPGKVNKALVKGTYLEFMSDPQLKPESIAFSKALVFSNVPPAEVRLRTEAGVLALARQVQRGTLVAVGFVPAPGYTDFQFNPNFVEFLLRMLWEARHWNAFYSDNGSLPDWRADWISRDHAYTLVDEKGLTRALALDGLGTAMRIPLPPDLEPGFYSIMEDGRERARFGHNADAGDSNLEPVRAADLEIAIKEGLTFSDKPDMARILGRRDLTAWLAGLLILAIALEAYAHFFRRV